MMFFLYTLVLEEITINQCMDTSGKAITVCKYGKSSCHGDCFIIPGMEN